MIKNSYSFKTKKWASRFYHIVENSPYTVKCCDSGFLFRPFKKSGENLYSGALVFFFFFFLFSTQNVILQKIIGIGRVTSLKNCFLGQFFLNVE